MVSKLTMNVRLTNVRLASSFLAGYLLSGCIVIGGSSSGGTSGDVGGFGGGGAVGSTGGVGATGGAGGIGGSGGGIGGSGGASSFCGDGVVNEGEACDDGNKVNADGCNADCVVSGTPLFTQSYAIPGAEGQYWTGVRLDDQGNIYVSGIFSVMGQGENGMVAKHDAAGNQVWIKTYNGSAGGQDRFSGVAVDKQGNAVVVGHEVVADGSLDLFVRKYGTAGNVVWTSTFAGVAGASEYGYGVAVNAVGDVFVSGSVQTVAGSGSAYDMLVVKFGGADGKLVWSDTVDSPANNVDEALAVAVDATNGVYLAGYQVGTNGADGWVRKYTDEGAKPTTAWTQTFNGATNGDDFVNSVAVDSSGNVIAGGAETVGGENQNTWLRKYDPAGATLWTDTYNDAAKGFDSLYGVAVDASGNIAVTGYESLADGSSDIWTRKYGPDGKVIWTQTYDGSAKDADFGYGVTMTPATGEVFVAGIEVVAGPEYKAWLRKFAP